MGYSGCERLSPLAIATITYNINDSPVGTIPITRVSPSLDALSSQWFDGSGHGSTLLERLVYGPPSSLHNTLASLSNNNSDGGGGKGGVYDAARMAGLPVGVQVVGRKWEEEKVLGMMRVVDRAVRKHGQGEGERGRGRGFGAGSSVEVEVDFVD